MSVFARSKAATTRRILAVETDYLRAVQHVEILRRQGKKATIHPRTVSAEGLSQTVHVVVADVQSRDPERGAVLIIVLLVMMALMGLGVTTLWLTSGNLAVGSALNHRQQALYVAEAGIDRAKAILNAAGAPPNLNALLAGSNPAWDKVPAALDEKGFPVGHGAILMDGATPLRNITFPPASFDRQAGTADAPRAVTMGSYTVSVRNDLSEARAGQFTTDTNQAVVVRSRGVAADGRTEVVVEVVLVPSGAAGAAAPGGGVNVEHCRYSGKNACDDNSSVLHGVRFRL